MDELEWSDCNETLDDILTNPRVQLPQLIKLSSNLKSINSDDILEKDQIIVIHAKKTIAKLEGTDGLGNPIRLPVSCPYEVRLKLAEGKEKVFNTIQDLTSSNLLPKFVEVTKVTDLESVKLGDHLKVVIVEKTGSGPSYIHFRSATGKHVKIAVDQDISFKLAVNDASEQLLANLAEKSRELPLVVEFVNKKETPKSHINLKTITINKGFTEDIIIASAMKSNTKFAVVFPLNSKVTFQVNSKLKLAKDEPYRELCSSFSNIDISNITNYLYVTNPQDEITQYVVKYKKLLKLSSDSDSEDGKKSTEKENGSKKHTKKESTLKTENNLENCNTLKLDQEQRDIVKKEQKEKERLAKLEKERLKAERKKEKKEQKEKEKEEKKRRKEKSIYTSASISMPIECVDNDLYIVPDYSSIPVSPTSECEVDQDEEHSHDSQQPQWALHLINKVKKVRDCTKSVGLKSKKQKLKKADAASDSTDIICESNRDSVYIGVHEEDDDAFSDTLYETLPDTAYESLDLIAQAKRTLAPPPSDNSCDSGFDEVDQAKIKAWRDSMVPPPLPGNHPIQDRIQSNNDENNMYEIAVDSSNSNGNTAWQTFYDIVEQSAAEISGWGIEDVANCLKDLKLGKCTSQFADSQVDGQLLLDLDESVLKDLGLSLFEARKLRKFVFGWRPDVMRPPNYAELKGFESKNPSDWSVADVVNHLSVIELREFSEFCYQNQVNGELLKDICVDDIIMNSIITSRDRKLKTVKIKNYVIDQWRPKKKGDSHYVSCTSTQNIQTKSLKSQSSYTLPASKTNNNGASPCDSQRRKLSENSPLGVAKKVGGDAPLVARMKQQLEEKRNDWESRRKPQSP